MAIIAAYTTRHGVSLPSAYINLKSMHFFKSTIEAGGDEKKHHSLSFSYAVFASKSARDSGMPDVEIVEKTMPFDTSITAHSQAYALISEELGGVEA